jgi:hypothetical protein
MTARSRRVRAASGPRWRRTGLVATALGGLAFFASSCLGSGYAYISHTNPDGTDVYFKVPSKWTTFDTDQIIVAENGPLGPSQKKQIANSEWLMGMTSEPGATAKDTLSLGNSYPSGIVEARLLPENQRDGLSFSTMRSEILGTDPLTATSGYQVLTYDEFTYPGGVRGVKFTVNITSKNKPTRTWGQVTAVDPQTNWIMAIGIGCKAECWGANSGAIKQILDSWTVKEQNP